MIIDTAIALVLIFGTLVVFHELGHLLVAKLVGIRVEEFAIGFGPKLVRLFKRGDTEYTIHPVPLGGFCKLAGMEPGEEDIPDGFQAQSAWKRALVIFAGPFASFILAMLVFVSLGVHWGFPDPAMPINRVGMVNPQTEAAAIDLKAGDQILAIDGTKITQGKQMTEFIHDRPGQKITILVNRDGREITKTAVPRWTVMYLGATWSFMGGNQPVVEGVQENSVAKNSGIKQGDKLVSIGGEEVNGGDRMVAAIKANGSKVVRLTLDRRGKPVDMEVKPDIQWVRFAGVKWGFPDAIVESGDGGISPKLTAGRAGIRVIDDLVNINGARIDTGEQFLQAIKCDGGSKLEMELDRQGGLARLVIRPTKSDCANLETGYYDSVGLLGFLPEPRLVRAGFTESVERGLSETLTQAKRIVQTLTSSRIKEEVGGPVLIAKAAASSVALGPYWVLMMLGSLSLSLAFVNLVPIPAVLDGGHLILIAIESVRRKRFTRDQMMTLQLVGFAMLAVIVVAVLFSDISKIAGGRVPQ